MAHERKHAQNVQEMISSESDVLKVVQDLPVEDEKNEINNDEVMKSIDLQVIPLSGAYRTVGEVKPTFGVRMKDNMRKRREQKVTLRKS